jgi:NAD(P)-dependent dehydrogenase (short-subunit alcohol dehydrogenase family)
MHHWSKIEDKILNDPSGPFEVLNSDPNRMRYRYMESKLLNIFFTRSLASLLSSTPVIVDSVNPGYCYSDMRRDLTDVAAKFHYYAEKLLAWTAEEGSRQLVWAALGGSGDVDRLRGAYISTMAPEDPADFIAGEGGKKRQDILWADLVRVLSRIDGRVPGIVDQFTSSH